MQDADGVPWQHQLSFISFGPRAWMWYIFYIIISMNQLSFGPSIPNRDKISILPILRVSLPMINSMVTSMSRGN